MAKPAHYGNYALHAVAACQAAMKGRSLAVLGLVLALALLPVARAGPAAIAQTEINYLLGFIETSGCEFYRNGSWYDSKKAQAHLRYKYQMLAAKDQIKTAEDFIAKAATQSSLSGRPYQVRCSGGQAVASSQWLREVLARYRGHTSLRAPPPGEVPREKPADRGGVCGLPVSGLEVQPAESGIREAVFAGLDMTREAPLERRILGHANDQVVPAVESIEPPVVILERLTGS